MVSLLITDEQRYDDNFWTEQFVADVSKLQSLSGKVTTDVDREKTKEAFLEFLDQYKHKARSYHNQRHAYEMGSAKDSFFKHIEKLVKQKNRASWF